MEKRKSLEAIDSKGDKCLDFVHCTCYHGFLMPKKVTTSFRLSPASLDELKKRLPRQGDRSALLSKLVEMYLQGGIKVPIQLSQT